MLPRIERVAQRIAHEGQQQQRAHQHGESEDGDPPGIDVVLALVQQLAERGSPGRHAQAEEVQRREREDGRAHTERQEGDDRRHAVGQNVAPDDLPVGHAQGTRGLHVVQLPVAQELRAHVVRQPHPAEQAEQDQQQRQARGEQRAEDDQQVQLGHRTPDLDEALEGQVRPPPEEPLDRARHQSQHHPGDGERQPEQHAHAKAVEQLREHVAAPVVRSQPVVGGRRGRVGRLREIVQRVGPVPVDRVERPVAARAQALLDEGVQVVGRRVEIPAEGGLGVSLEQREIRLPLVVHDERLVVAHQLRRQADGHQHAEDHEAPEPQPVALEAHPRATGR